MALPTAFAPRTSAVALQKKQQAAASAQAAQKKKGQVPTLQPTGPAIQVPGGQPPVPYQGQTVAPFTPAQKQGQQSLLDTAASIKQTLGQALSGGGGLNFFTSGAALDPTRNPGLQGAISAAVDPLQRTFLETILPGIRDNAILAGGYGGSRQGIAEGMATEGLLREVGNVTANVVNPAYQSGLGATVQALGQTPALTAAQAQPGQLQMNVGALQQAMNQAGLDAAQQKYIQEQFYPLMIASEIASIAFGTPQGSTVTGSSGGSIGGGQLAAGLGSILGGLAGSFASPGVGTAAGAAGGSALGSAVGGK